MFNKKHNKIETLTGLHSLIKGEAEIKGTIRVDGRFEGHLKADWVVVGEKGYLKGDIRATGVIVGGTIEGNIFANDSLEIQSKGKVCGDVQTQKLTITEGGLFEGKSKMNKEDKQQSLSVVKTGELNQKNLSEQYSTEKKAIKSG